MMRVKRILMTGCGSSFGKTIYYNLLDQGHSICGVGGDGPNYTVDFDRDMYPDAVRETFDWYMNTYEEPPEILINNVGDTQIDFLDNHKLSDFETVLYVNLTVPFQFCKYFAAQILEHQDTSTPVFRIINTSSMGAVMGLRGSPGYCASKAGLEALGRVLAKEFAGKKPIGVYTVAPGPVENSGMAEYAVERLMETRGMTLEEAEAYSIQSPLQRRMAHDELWSIYSFLVNDAPMYMSGSVISCPGGMGI